MASAATNPNVGIRYGTNFARSFTSSSSTGCGSAADVETSGDNFDWT